MHELSIALSILEIAEEEAERRNAHIAAIHLKLGPLSGVVKEALLSAYELAAQQTGFGDCSLIIRDIPISAFCPQCQTERKVRSMQCFQCADCGALVSEIIHGKELQISALELMEGPYDDHASYCRTPAERPQT